MAEGGHLLADLQAWLDPSSIAESKREAALVPDLPAFRSLASARAVVGGGGRAGWSLEGDMQLCEVSRWIAEKSCVTSAWERMSDPMQETSTWSMNATLCFVR